MLFGSTSQRLQYLNCHWDDNLAGKDSISFQSPIGQIMLQSPKLKLDKDV
jgi:hypothetical protein